DPMWSWALIGGPNDHKRKSSFATTGYIRKMRSKPPAPATARMNSMQGGRSFPRLKARSEPSEAGAKGRPQGLDERPMRCSAHGRRTGEVVPEGGGTTDRPSTEPIDTSQQNPSTQQQRPSARANSTRQLSARYTSSPIQYDNDKPL